ncbi:riboflavin synthase [Moheibacter lacus]|uniref:Riboflavin synthase n=1 Tax=Moheibacter lacus TaxID=2745851 RepID=A0A838ZS69_9FLAO|nr:riboflavin synthase [Moheibacter lacus]MBA5629009.1 riboflavin synthase [Moheibacter lacus]
MFTGIVENIGTIERIEKEESNVHFWLSCAFTNELKIDQSVSHNGVCLTVVEISDAIYKVTAIDETLKKTNLGQLLAGNKVNLERCMRFNDRLDGHIVQGHVDQTAVLKSIENEKGSYVLTFLYDEISSGNVTVPKGSICVNGISLTVVDSKVGEFSVAIIPYTWENTNLHELKSGDIVNLEFDIIGKYIQRLMNR